MTQSAAPDLVTVPRENIAEALTQACEYFENRADVVDGDYGIPEPNTEMRLAQMCSDALSAIPSSDPEGGARGVQTSIATKHESCPESATRTETAIVAALQDCQRVLAMMIDPASIKTTSSMQAWAAAVQAETKVRRLLDDNARQDESQAKATEGKAGNAEGTPLVRQTTTGTGLRVGAADAVQPATSEFMDVTAGETAPSSDYDHGYADGVEWATKKYAPGTSDSAPNHQPHAVSQGWRTDLENAPGGVRFLIAGRYPNGIWYVEESYRHYAGHFNGRKIDPPTHWMPLPAPPSPAKTDPAPSSVEEWGR